MREQKTKIPDQEREAKNCRENASEENVTVNRYLREYSVICV